MKKALAAVTLALLIIGGGYIFYQRKSLDQQYYFDYSSIKDKTEKEQEKTVDSMLKKIKQESDSEENYRKRLFEFIEFAPSSLKKAISTTMRKKSAFMNKIQERWIIDDLITLKTNVPLFVPSDKDGKPLHPKKSPPTTAQYKKRVKEWVIKEPRMNHVFTILGKYDF